VDLTEHPQQDPLVGFLVKINNAMLGHFRSNLPMWMINWFNVDGQMGILEDPFIYYKVIFNII
jgi:hypothetical protein